MIADSDSSHAEEDENYFVSMTDMMVGILFIFIIMLMVFALNFRQRTDEQEDKLQIAKELTEQIEKLQAQINREFAALNEADAARRRLLETIRDRLAVQGVIVQIDEANGVLRLTENAVRFAPGSSIIDLGLMTANVQKIAGTLAETLPAYTLCKPPGVCAKTDQPNRVETVFIEGHTDVTKPEGNWQLSAERAVNTYRKIIETAPSLRLLRNDADNEILSVSGYSSTRPIAKGTSLDDYALNRRIDLRFVMAANQRERLSEVSRLLDEMQRKIQMLHGSRGPTAVAPTDTRP